MYRLNGLEVSVVVTVPLTWCHWDWPAMRHRADQEVRSLITYPLPVTS